MGRSKQDAPIPAQPMPLPKKGGGGGGFPKEYGEVMSGYRDFSKTGGFSPMDISNMRSRAVSPVRAVYANAMQNVERQRALQGGYSPGFGALQSRMARERSSGTSDAAINAEAELAGQIQQGKLAGLSGMASNMRMPSGGGGGGGGAAGIPVPEEKKGFWGKLGGGLKKVGKIALPIALNYVSGGGYGAARGLSSIARAAGGSGNSPAKAGTI